VVISGLVKQISHNNSRHVRQQRKVGLYETLRIQRSLIDGIIAINGFARLSAASIDYKRSSGWHPSS